MHQTASGLETWQQIVYMHHYYTSEEISVEKVFFQQYINRMYFSITIK